MNTNVLVARKSLGLTHEKLAKALKLNQADIVRVEKHGWTPPPPIRKRFADVLHQSEAALFPEVVGARQ